MAKACKNKQVNKALLEEQLKPFTNLRAALVEKMVRGDKENLKTFDFYHFQIKMF